VSAAGNSEEDIMNFARRKCLQVFLIAAIALPAFQAATAQTYPSRPITLIVPYAVGGPTDTVARIIAERMRTSLGQTVVVENVASASGIIGVGRAARASGDGYTLTLGTQTTHAINGAIYALAYDVQRDFAPIGLISGNPGLVVAKKALPANDLKELVAWLKANPGKATAGTVGMGSTQHVGGVLFQNMTGTRFQFVPYRGAAPAMQDLIAGQIDVIIADSSVTSLPQVRAGTIKAYAVTAKSHLAAAPDIPTADEAGLPGLHIANWYGLFAPKGTPKSVIARVSAAVIDALADPAVPVRLGDLGQEIFPREQQTPEAFAAFQKAEIERLWPIIKAAGIKGE
jgi:tripartite-type tricarboxylate transporter receptor subunit TctC